MKPKKRGPNSDDPRRLTMALTDEEMLHVKKCAQAMLQEPDRMHPPTKPAVVRWALAKCAADVRAMGG